MYNQKMGPCFSQNLPENHGTLYQKCGLIEFSHTQYYAFLQLFSIPLRHWQHVTLRTGAEEIRADDYYVDSKIIILMLLFSFTYRLLIPHIGLITSCYLRIWVIPSLYRAFE